MPPARPGPPPSLDEALALHRGGSLDAAARAYQDLLAADPGHADALHLLGVIAHQRGDLGRAVELIQRAIGLAPGVAAYHANLAEVYRARGQLDRAAGCCRTALRIDPGHAEAANNLGLVLLQQGKPGDAVAPFETALRLRPDFALACNNLANCHRLLGDPDRAVALLRRALALDPGLAEAHTNLGQLLTERGDTDAALTHCREAVRLQPDAAEGHNNLGNALRAAGRLAEARACYAEALRLNPDLALAHRNMGQALQEEGKAADAVPWYRQALELDPDSAQTHCYLGSAFEELENFADAAVHYGHAARLDPAFAEAHNGLGWALHELGQFHPALECFRTALRLRPDFPAAACNVAHSLKELGEFAAAERAFRDVLARHPDHAGAHGHLATLLGGRLPEADERALVRLLADPDLGDGGRLDLHFALAHVLDARGAYDRAAEHARQANALALADQGRRGRTYDPAEHRRFVDDLLAVCTPDWFGRVRGFGPDTERPVFVVGLPRSGTTLTEQVLAGHPRVHGAGELRLARDDFLALAGPPPAERLPFEPLARLDRDTAQALARRHLGRLDALNATAGRVVDKMPDNYLHLGLLAALFPRAKFIHCRRDLRDVAVSCWLTNFRSIRWASDPDHLATRFAEYERVMAHWRRVLPVPLLEVRYEELVDDLEGVARRLLAFCGLEWEPACLAFHEVRRPVGTASVVQVRQPLYRRSVGRWRHYGEALGPLFARLPADPIETR